jgi:hypothetical protein
MNKSVMMSAGAIMLGFALSAVPLVAPHRAAAQNPVLRNVVPESEALTIHAKITAIDPGTRAVTLAGAAGNRVTVTAGPNVRLEMLKVGDAVNAKYYRSVAFMVTPPSTGSNAAPTSNDQINQALARPVEAPGGVGIRTTQVQGAVVGIDLADNTVDVVNPSGGGVYTLHVTDPARIPMLASLKVGDTITAVVSQVVAVSIEPAPKNWF